VDIKDEIKQVLKDRVTFTRNGKVVFSGMTTTALKFYPTHKNELDEMLTPQTRLELLTGYNKSRINTLFESTLAQLFKDFRSSKASEKGFEAPKDYQGIVCHQSGDIHLIDPDTESVAEVTYSAYSQILTPEAKTSFKDSLMIGKVVYDPYDVVPITDVVLDGRNALRLNLYTPPLWRTREFTPSCPEPIKKLLQHLFPVADHRSYVLDWMYRTILSRNECYLVLNGAKGVGKGVFMALMRAISGQHNYSEAPDSLLDSQFNSVLDRKRVIALDEFRVDKEKHTKLKRYANKFQNIEKKGIDADKLIETFNSFIIANNDETDMYIEFDDRRFSVPELTQLRLEETLTTEEIDALMEEFEDAESEIVGSFGHWLLNRKERSPYGNSEALKSDKFYRLVYVSLAQWQKWLVDEIAKAKDLGEKELNLTMARKTAERKNTFRIPQYSKVKDFLINYRPQEGDQLGLLKKVDNQEIVYFEGVESEESADEYEIEL
jgi:hypothetical protein